jgi:hypothetical protein
MAVILGTYAVYIVAMKILTTINNYEIRFNNKQS